MPDPAALAWFGTDEPPAPRQVLRAGALVATLEAGGLRHVTWHGVEVVRGIAFVVRDTGWATLAPEIVGLEIDERDGRFVVTYAARCAGPDGAFRFQARIEGGADGRLRFAAEGAAEGGAVATNRIGFVMLHPVAGVAGSPLTIEHGNGGTTRSHFPALIAPHAPATDIAALHHAVAGWQVACRFEGETFEMEDQRNWGDASFKTYCRPLARGFPYTIAPGEAVAQAVTLAIAGQAAAVAPVPPPRRFRMPRIALALDAADATPALAELVRATGVGRILVRLDPLRTDLRKAAAALAAFDMPITLEPVIPARDPEAELAAIAHAGIACDEVMPIALRDFVSRPTGTPAGEADAAAIAQAARRIFPGRRIIGGTPGFFTELNRNPPDAAGIDGIQSAFCAIVHAADDISVMETLDALGDIGASMAALAPGAERRLATATITMRDSMDSPFPLPNPHRHRLARAALDPRHAAGFGAAWATAFARHAGAAGIDLVAPAMVTGPLGLLLPDGGVSPLFGAVQALAQAAGSVVEG